MTDDRRPRSRGDDSLEDDDWNLEGVDSAPRARTGVLLALLIGTAASGVTGLLWVKNPLVVLGVTVLTTAIFLLFFWPVLRHGRMAMSVRKGSVSRRLGVRTRT
jgi:membrane protein YdbS with pleckstrin-like domain